MWFDGSAPEQCARCGFDSWCWTRLDSADVLALTGDWWRRATAGLNPDALNTRPADGVWSALEYGLHTVMVLPILGWFIQATLATDRAQLVDPYADVEIEDNTQHLILDRDEIVARIEAGATDLARLVGSHQEGWDHVGRTEADGERWWQAEATLKHVLHDTTHHWLDVGEGLARIGAAAPSIEGKVASVVARDGRARPDRAITVAAKAPSAAGRVGLEGLDWSVMRSGTRILVGHALLELSQPVPGVDDAWFAFLRRAGRIEPGDVALVSPPG